MMLTQQELMEHLDYDPASGSFVRIKAPCNSVKIGTVAGRLTDRGYCHISVIGRQYAAHRLAYLYMTGEWPSAQIDHLNGDPSDNRWSNLRAVSATENQRNRRLNSNNTTGACGVRWRAGRCRWEASIGVGGRLMYLGYFVTKGDAIRARKRAEAQYGFRAGHGVRRAGYQDARERAA